MQIDQSVLFLRCTAVAQRENEDITSYFAHEMTAVSTSLFTYLFMRNVDKSELGREIKKNMRKSMSDKVTQLMKLPLLDSDCFACSMVEVKRIH